MPSFADSIFLFVLALLLFGPKRLPVLARELGKWVGEFRRASNEFKMQMEDELRASEQADRQKQIAAMEAAAPLPPKLEEAEPEHPHMRHAATAPEATIMPQAETTPGIRPEAQTALSEPATKPHTADDVRPIPIAVSGSLAMMPPATGLPTPRSRNGNGHASPADDALGGLLESIPQDNMPESATPEVTNHGD